MKKITYLFLLLSIFVFFVGIVHAQDSSQSAATATPIPTDTPFNFDKAYKDYVFMSDQYSKAHNDFLLAEAQYAQAQTLASQTKAKEATAAMLIARDNVLSAYLNAIRQKLVEGEGIDPTNLNGLTGRIDTDVAWYKNHSGKIDSSESLVDLTADSKTASTHYSVTEALAYESLANLPLGREVVLRNTLNDILSNLQSKIAQIRLNGDLDTSNAERYVIETQNKLGKSLDKEVAAQKLIPDLQGGTTTSQNKNKATTYTSVVSLLNESIQFLKEASSFVGEVMKAIVVKQ